MAQMNSIQVRQGWALLHEREQPRRRVDARSEAERAVAARRVEERLTRQRERVFADFATCSRTYY